MHGLNSSDQTGFPSKPQSHSDRSQPVIIGVGAVYIDVILTIPDYPPEDSKRRASARERRRGGNVPNTLDVLGQLFTAAKIDTSAFIVMPLPAEDSLDTRDIIASFPSGISIQHAVFRPDKTDAPTSYILRSQSSDSRTIVSYNEVGELTVDDFYGVVPGITSRGQLVYHFEGRTPDVILKCMRHLRQRQPSTQISVELEKPEREGLDDLAEQADIVFHSKIWAQSRGYNDAEECVREQAVKLPKAKYLFCTWGDQGAAGLYQDGSVYQVESSTSFTTGLAVVDTIGAGDTFIGAVLFGLYYGEPEWTLQRTLRFANEVAGRKVVQEGLKDLTRDLSEWLN